MKQRILDHLPRNHPWAGNIHYFDTIDSTNTEAKRLAAAGAPHGTVLIAGHQTGGRGRMGRSFHSPAGLGIYLSVILRPECAPGDLMHLTCAAAVAMCDAVENAAGFRPGIKWTNDLVYGKRKLGGILTELAFGSSGRVDYAVIGIGINCRHGLIDFPEEIRKIAGSLSMAAAAPVDTARVAAAMIMALHTMDHDLLTQKSALMDRYRADCITLGREISVHRFDEIRHGTAVDLDDDGGLVVRFSDGHTETVSSGEVSVRGMYGYAE